MPYAVFIDGPLAQEVRNIESLLPEWKVPLPARTTECWCSGNMPDIIDNGPEIFAYHRVMTGNGIALYSKNLEPYKLLQSLKEWVYTDLSGVDRLIYGCRDRRAFQ